MAPLSPQADSAHPFSRLSWTRPVVLAILLFFSSSHSAADTTPPIAIEGFAAMLFNSQTGAFSADIFGKDPPELGNVPIGNLASVSTFVIVKVRLGNHAQKSRGVRVHFVATESGSQPFAANLVSGRDRVIMDQTSSLGPVSADGLTHVGFWLASTGCRSIALQATLLGVPGGKPSKNVLPFTCYE